MSLIRPAAERNLAAVPDPPQPPGRELVGRTAGELEEQLDLLLGALVERSVRDTADPYGGVDALTDQQLRRLRDDARQRWMDDAAKARNARAEHLRAVGRGEA